MTVKWLEPTSSGVPAPLSPDMLVWYTIQVTNDTGVVVVPEFRVYHPTTSASVNLSIPCENYTVTVRAENKAGSSMNVSESFSLVENGECVVSTYELSIVADYESD